MSASQNASSFMRSFFGSNFKNAASNPSHFASITLHTKPAQNTRRAISASARSSPSFASAFTSGFAGSRAASALAPPLRFSARSRMVLNDFMIVHLRRLVFLAEEPTTTAHFARAPRNQTGMLLRIGRKSTVETHMLRLATVVLSLTLLAAAQAAPPPSTPICKPGAAALSGPAAVARNLATVQAIYAAFGKGDVPAILACIAPDAHWEAWADNRAQAAGVPWLKPQTGPAGVTAFFAYIGKWKVIGFAVKNVMGAGSNVAAEVEVDFDITQTGNRLKDQEIHYWTFNDRGQITGLRHYNDTAKHIAAAKSAK